jgi:hypothetical protein
LKVNGLTFVNFICIFLVRFDDITQLGGITMRGFGIALLLFVISTTPIYSQTEPKPLVMVSAIEANVREFPSTSSKVQFKVRKGDVLRLEMPTDSNGWLAVRLEKSGLSGWIAKGLVSDPGKTAENTTAFASSVENRWKLVSARRQATGMLVGIYLNEANFEKIGDTVDFWVKEVPLPKNGSQLQEYLGIETVPNNYMMFSHRLYLENADCTEQKTLLRKKLKSGRTRQKAHPKILKE